jgi:hypothetical protein
VIAAVAAIAVSTFRYERTLRPAGPAAPVELLPDGAMYAHAQPDFSDLRILDARGNQVPWRLSPPARGVTSRTLPVFDAGVQDGLAVARVRVPVPVQRASLEIPTAGFVGLATAYGSSDGRTWTRLSTTQVYDVVGAVHARSTTVLLPPNDFRLLEFRVSHVAGIAGVTVTTRPRTRQLERLPAHVRSNGSVVVVDLGHANIPVDELRVTATTRRYDRPFTLSTGESGELVRLGPPATTVVPVAARVRYVRIRIENGDDPPLRGLEVSAWARPRPLLLEDGHPGPFTVYYGARLAPPSYDWARLPLRGVARPSVLGPERANPAFRLVDRRSFFAKHPSLVTAVLALCAAAVIAAGALALRRT